MLSAIIEILVRGQRTESILSEEGGDKDIVLGVFPQGLISETGS